MQTLLEYIHVQKLEKEWVDKYRTFLDKRENLDKAHRLMCRNDGCMYVMINVLSNYG